MKNTAKQEVFKDEIALVNKNTQTHVCKHVCAYNS